MANYRRFVTYFYSYSNGVRGAICGFGKIEYGVRSRIHLTMKGRRSGREECFVYGMGRDPEQVHLLGELVLNGGKGNFTWEWNGKDPKADAFVRRMGGIALCRKDSGDLICAAKWDGVEDIPERFVTRDEKEEKAAGQNKKEEKALPDGQEEEKERPGGVVESAHMESASEPVQSDHEESTSESVQAEGKERASEPVQAEGEERASDPVRAEGEERASEPVQAEEEERASEPAQAEEEERASEPVQADRGERSSEAVQFEMEQEREAAGREEKGKELFSETGKFVEDPLEVAAASANVIVENPEGKRTKKEEDPPLWQQMCQRYPGFLPFLPSCRIECLKIRLGDLGGLPRENWALANNSFLLRGYDRCHYLVLAKRDEGAACAYYIGIPGIYLEREARLAHRFGFLLFCPYKGGALAPGKSGLWMMPIRLEE